MKQHNHTPGPWKATERTITYKQFNIETVDQTHTSTFIGEVGGGLQPSQEIEANARLIAAAPELLEALKIVLWDMENGEAEAQRQGKPRFSQRHNIVKNAIAKATGVNETVEG